MFDTHVTPAHPGATILDPLRSRPLPEGGAPVAWGPYWANLARRGDIVARPLVPEAPAETAPETDPATGEPAAPEPDPAD